MEGYRYQTPSRSLEGGKGRARRSFPRVAQSRQGGFETGEGGGAEGEAAV